MMTLTVISFFLVFEMAHDIADTETGVTPVHCENHPSARPAATKKVLKEIENGNYEVCQEPPKIVSPMSAIPKLDGDVRLIHDCSRPVGEAVNDYYSTDRNLKFAKVDDASKLMSPGCFFAKVDLKSAYRSAGISKASQEVTGLHLKFKGQSVYLRDTKLPFGAKLSVGIFHRLTQAVKRMMSRRGFDLTIVYLDNFLIISQSKEQCAQALAALIHLLRKLGFSIHCGKVIDPTNVITFLGIELDSLSMSLRLPDDKLSTLCDELNGFLNRKRATKRQLQSAAGRLLWAASIVKG